MWSTSYLHLDHPCCCSRTWIVLIQRAVGTRMMTRSTFVLFRQFSSVLVFQFCSAQIADAAEVKIQSGCGDCPIEPAWILFPCGETSCNRVWFATTEMQIFHHRIERCLCTGTQESYGWYPWPSIQATLQSAGCSLPLIHHAMSPV